MDNNDILEAANLYAGNDDTKFRGFITAILCKNNVTKSDILWAEKFIKEKNE